jgi:hypothetical protein
MDRDLISVVFVHDRYGTVSNLSSTLYSPVQTINLPPRSSSEPHHASPQCLGLAGYETDGLQFAEMFRGAGYGLYMHDSSG